MTSIKSDFPEHKKQDWLNAILKTLKLDSESEIERHIQFGSLENFDYHLNPSRNSNGLHLNTFPDQTKLIREVLHHEELGEGIVDGIDYFLSQSALKKKPEDKSIQIVRETKTEHFGDLVLIDVLKIFESFDFDKERSLSFLENELKKENTHLLIDSSPIHCAGLNICSELAVAINYALSVYKYTHASKRKIYFMTATDSMFFASIAKLRALRYTFETILENSNLEVVNSFALVAKPSMREVTAYEPWVNALRSTVSSAAHLIAGADFSVAGEYNSVLQSISHKSSSALSKRQSRNIFHILNLESSLGFIKDPSKGSFLIEDISRQIVTKTFEELKDLAEKEDWKSWMQEVSQKAKEDSLKRANEINKRRKVICGVNDFADIENDLAVDYTQENFSINEEELFPLKRTTTAIESLRFQVQGDKENSVKKILIFTFGNRKRLSARINFVQNYFEVLGLQTEIVEYDKSIELSSKKYFAMAYCALDSDYSEMFKEGAREWGLPSFIAGKKFEHKDMTNIYGGQDILDVLTKLVQGVIL